MSLTSTQVANRALGKIGATPITSLADDPSKNARDIRACYDIVLKDELRARCWSFSIKRANLVELEQAPLFDWERQFALPADFIRLVETSMSGSPYGRSYLLEGNKLLTNQTEVKLRYIANITDPAQWDSSFVEAFACRLAAEIAEPVTQSLNKRSQAWAEYQQAVSKARMAGAVEQDTEAMQDDTWVLARDR